MAKIDAVDVIPLRIPFEDGSAGVGLMPSKWTHLDMALVCVRSDDGAIGWGDGFAYSCLAPVARAISDMVAPLVIGAEVPETPAALADFNVELQRKLHLHGRYGITTFAISGVDIALHDLAARRAGQSLAAFLEAASARDSITAYASLVRYGDPGQVRDFAARAVAEGYQNVKLHEITPEAIRAGREGVGADVRLTTDVNCNWPRGTVRDMMAVAEDLDLYWVEEPLFPPDDVAALSELETEFAVAIASGENACTSVEFARIVPAITFAQPSVTKVGGVSEFLKVCDLARGHGKTIMPHAPYFGPGYWATVQMMAARPECGLFERFYITPEAFIDPSIPWPDRGEIAVPHDVVGHGCTPDAEIIARYRVEL